MTTPAFYVRHTRKAEWGLGVLVDSEPPYFRYFFEDGELRSFPEASLSLLSSVDATPEEQEALQSLRTSRKRQVSSKKKKTTIPDELRGGPDSTRKIAVAAPMISSLPQQVERFLSQFPKGFEDERYLDQERGGHGSRKIGRQGIVDLAQESFQIDKLRKILLEGKGVGAANLYKKLLTKGKTLFSSSEEIEPFNLFAKAPPSELRLAEALFDLLHGSGPVGARLEALSTALPVELRTWRLCTFPGAFFDPASLLFVDPNVTFRQAHIIGVEVSFENTISGSTYELLLKMAEKLSAELPKSRLRPRDLLDVHLFTANTLHTKK